jgi:hypothetical protein
MEQECKRYNKQEIKRNTIKTKGTKTKGECRNEGVIKEKRIKGTKYE